jgi:hypothetical protein
VKILLRLLRIFGIVVVAAAVLYTAVDLTYGYLKNRPTTDDAAFNPAAHISNEGQDYATPEFQREVGRQPGKWDRIPGQNLAAPSEFHGQYFNVDRLPPTDILYRRTINPGNPGKPQIVVLVVGSSTIYGATVPDGFTIPSLMSTRLNALDPAHDYVVYNAGVYGTNTTEDRDRLAYELSRGLKPGIIVVIDGPLDIAYGIYQGHPEGSTTLQAHRGGLRGFIRRYAPMNIFMDLLRWFNRRAAESGMKQPPAHLKDPAAVARLTKETMDIYYRNEVAMAEMAKAKQIRFLTVINPSVYSAVYTHPTKDLSDVVKGVEAEAPGLGATWTMGYAALSQEMLKLKAQGIDTLDLSDMLKDKTVNVFADPGHLNGTGNAAVADRIAEALLRPAAAAQP